MSEAAFKTTIKHGTGTASWTTVAADDIDLFVANLQALVDSLALELIEDAQVKANAVHALNAPEPVPAPPVDNNTPALQQPVPAPPSAGGLIPRVTTHPTAACKCGQPLVYKKTIDGKFGPSHVFECPDRDWQDEESKAAHDSKFVKA